MPIPAKITKFLESSKVKYEVLKHRTVYTAFDKSQTLRVKPSLIGKTLVLRLDNKPVIVLIPADKNLDKNLLKKTLKAKKIDFIKEAWMKKTFKGIKLGAIPPFGNLWKINTVVDKNLLFGPKVILNSGHYNFSIKINSSAFKKLVPDLLVFKISKKK